MSAGKDKPLRPDSSQVLDARLAAYLTSAAALGATMASKSEAAVVANITPQAININGEVDIDFDGDGVPEFQIDHDRYDLGGNDIDYLQLDKNDANSPDNALNIQGLAAFSSTSNTYEPPFSDDYDDNHNGSWDAGDLNAWETQYGAVASDLGDPNTFPSPDGNENGVVEGGDFLIWQRANPVDFSYDQSYMSDGNGFYPNALASGTSIGPTDFFDFSETSDAFGGGTFLRANRLIDEDVDNNNKSLIDASLLGGSVQVEEHPDSAQFVGLGGATRYLGVRFDLHDEGYSNNLPLVNGPDLSDDPDHYWYGWIGIEITNEADATGNVTGWAYESDRGVAISAGDDGTLSGLGSVPEPGSLIIAAFCGAALFTRFGWQKVLGDKR